MSNYLRQSDNCLSQFKSRNTLYDLLEIRRVWPSLESARFSCFEPHEGKALSDVAGALAKLGAANETMRLGDASALTGTRTSIAQEYARRIRAGLSYDEDGRVGSFEFFR